MALPSSYQARQATMPDGNHYLCWYRTWSTWGRGSFVASVAFILGKKASFLARKGHPGKAIAALAWAGQAARGRPSSTTKAGKRSFGNPERYFAFPPIFCFSFQSSFKSSTFACVGQFDYVFWYGILHLLVHYTLPMSGCNWLLSAAADQKVQGSKMTKLVGSLFGSCFSHLHHKWHVTFWAGLFFSKFFLLFNSVIFLAVHIKFKSMFFTYSFKNAFICKN